ncbi:MAG: hypothetical protein MHMPM18_003723 [Marteilia pararefringens]
MKLYVGNLPENVSENDVKKLFERYGKVVDCSVLRTYAFVNFNLFKICNMKFYLCRNQSMSSHEEALDALKSLKNYIWMGKAIQVQMSHSKSRHSSSAASQSSVNYNSNISLYPETEKRNFFSETASMQSDELTYCAGCSSQSVANIYSSASTSSKRHKTNKQTDFIPTQEAITYVKEEILNDPVARLMLLHDILAIMKKVNDSTQQYNNSNKVPTPPPVNFPQSNQSFASPLPTLIPANLNHSAPCLMNMTANTSQLPMIHPANSPFSTLFGNIHLMTSNVKTESCQSIDINNDDKNNMILHKSIDSALIPNTSAFS